MNNIIVTKVFLINIALNPLTNFEVYHIISYHNIYDYYSYDGKLSLFLWSTFTFLICKHIFLNT